MSRPSRIDELNIGEEVENLLAKNTIEKTTDLINQKYSSYLITRSSVSRYRQKMLEKERIRYALKLRSELAKALSDVKTDLRIAIEQIYQFLGAKSNQKRICNKYMDSIYENIVHII